MTSNSKRILSNASWLYAAELFSRILTVVLTVIIARVLGADSLGQLIFAGSIVGIANVFSDFGLSLYLVKTLSQNLSEETAVLDSIVGVRYLSASLALFLASGYVFLTINDDTILKLVVISLVASLLGVYPGIVFSLYRVREKMIYESFVRIATAVIYSLGGLAIIKLGYGVLEITAWALILALPATIYAWFLAKKIDYQLKINFNFREIRKILIKALPFGSLVVLVTIYFRVDSVMIEHILGTKQVGLYGSAYRVMEMMLILPGILSGAFLPWIARIIKDDKEKVLVVVRRSIRILWSLAVPLSIGLLFFSEKGLFLIFGSKFTEAGPVLIILGFTLIPLFASAMTSMIITSSDKPQVNTSIAAGMVVLNIGLNLILIPALGIIGAGWSTLATETLGLVAGTIYINKFYGQINFVGFLTKPLIASTLMGLSVLFSGANFYLIPFYVTVYFVVLLLIGGVDTGDQDLLKRIILRRKTLIVGEDST